MTCAPIYVPVEGCTCPTDIPVCVRPLEYVQMTPVAAIKQVETSRLRTWASSHRVRRDASVPRPACTYRPTVCQSGHRLGDIHVHKSSRERAHGCQSPRLCLPLTATRAATVSDLDEHVQMIDSCRYAHRAGDPWKPPWSCNPTLVCPSAHCDPLFINEHVGQMECCGGGANAPEDRPRHIPVLPAH